MKKLTILMITILIGGSIYSQQLPSGTASPAVNWRRGGNFQGGGAGPNIFGTFFNSPIYTFTNSLARMKLNGDVTANINGYTNVNTNGFLLVGRNANSFSGQNLYTDIGAYSQLHLNGSTGNNLQEYGYRPWMRTGVTLTDNEDLSYFGLRKLSANPNQRDITETVLMWSDNADANQYGPDRLVFRFSGWQGNDGASVSANRLSSTDLDGLHVAQFTGRGFMGLGNTFGTNAAGMNAANYIDPQSLFHMSYDWRANNTTEGYGFMQVTYRTRNNFRGSGETARDGLRLGIDNQVNNPIQGLYAYLRWQENTPFVIQTDWNDNPGGIQNGERMRITTTGALINDNQYFGVNPNGGNTTRLGVSHNGGIRVNRPMSLMHLGYDVVQGQTGWRSWMDVGTLYSIGGNFGDNMYVGMKNEGFDRFDAVINWGDNQPNTDGGSDYLRFIFTSKTQGNQGDSVSRLDDGLEIMRMDPKDGETYQYNNFGMVGIGNFAANGPNTALEDVIDAKLDIDGDLRIRGLLQNDTLNQYLVIDSTDHNRVYWTSVPPGGGMGHYCSDTITNPLTDNYEIPLADYNYYFQGQEAQVSNVGIGVACNTLTFAKLHVYQTKRNYLGPISAAGFFHDETVDAVGTGLGVLAIANGTNAQNNIGGYFEAQNGAFTNIGVYARADGSATGNPQTNNNLAGYFDGDVLITGSFGPSDENLKTNIQDYQGGLAIINQLSPKTFEYDHASYPSMNLSAGNQYGLIAQDVEAILPDLVTETIHPAEYDSLGNILHQPVSFKGLKYQQLIPVLISGVQELDSMNTNQQNEIDSLNSVIDSMNNIVNDMNNRLSNLENCLSNILPMLCQMNQSMIQQNDQGAQEQLRSVINVELENGENIVLNQNVPNPFAEQTIITYSIPSSVNDAVIMFYDSKGIMIKEVKIDTRGQGQLNVYGSDLSRGLYTYTLIADGQVVATKKMVKK